MTSEERLNRLERIAKLFARAGLRERKNRHELDQNIKMVISAQIENEERFRKNEERFSRLADAHAETEKAVKELAGAQQQTDERLRALIDIVAQDRNGRRG